MSIGIRGVGVRFGSRVVLEDVWADFRPATVSCLMGPSGAGKSTLLAVVAGYIAPSEGTIEISDGDRARLAFVAQSTPLLLRRTVIDNVAVGVLARGGEWGEALSIAGDLLSTLSMDGLGPSRAYVLSGGERQRVAILRAIAQRATVLLADEPTASLDQENKESVVRALRVAAQEGATVVVATHDPFVAQAADTVISL